MTIRCIWEHNGEDTLLYAEEYPGAYARGKSFAEASAKMKEEICLYCLWADIPVNPSLDILVVQEKVSELAICDADSDVLFDNERHAMTMPEYLKLKMLTMKSAYDFEALYQSVPDKDYCMLSERNTFYGPVPRTAEEMYQHTKKVNDYYFGEIGIDADHKGTIAECRQRGFSALEQKPDFLRAPACEGSYGEEWSLRKMLRRFLWHDRIHAKAMWRKASVSFGKQSIENPFFFDDAD